ncbi:hypothetical protein A2304_03580 [Candidatus Uhrbacteria bacterium RIFOXYB2_FULL_57_15]|uniref:Uncharacterized protein n=1 Tax=Candidatus Uhrbacteria bacterium RIFOXYB2_FULL_57_15 TaxID=1802422 RepID=A0A1F7W5P4_9BACT|nr:MAG: hypothetical protein A2304_03580 [Candidatus Uhrbacteria bacterium RIFOXYB2_FULL_57_15]OGM00117.1 MAG: hypothetical protein A2501_01235 [Candidatus Uhrbacteria bacterium RIFOXYC12_FULL_57_11]
MFELYRVRLSGKLVLIALATSFLVGNIVGIFGFFLRYGHIPSILEAIFFNVLTSSVSLPASFVSLLRIPAGSIDYIIILYLISFVVTLISSWRKKTIGWVAAFVVLLLLASYGWTISAYALMGV